MSFLSDVAEVILPAAGGVVGATFGNVGAAVGTGIGALAAGADSREALGASIGSYGISALASGKWAPTTESLYLADQPADVPVVEKSTDMATGVPATAAPVATSDAVSAAQSIPVIDRSTVAPAGLNALTDSQASWYDDIDWSKAGLVGLAMLGAASDRPPEAPGLDMSQPLNRRAPSNLTFGADQLSNYGNVQESYVARGPAQGYAFGADRNPLDEANMAYQTLRS